MGWNSCQRGLIWKIANGAHINLWNQPWLAPLVHLLHLIQGPLNKNDECLTVSSITRDTTWNFFNLSFDLPHSIQQIIKATYIPLYMIGFDQLTWGLCSNGMFSVNSCYKSLYNHPPKENTFDWIWKLRIPPKIKTFL